VVGEAADGAEVLTAVDRYAPDVVLMDIRMPRVDGLAATEQLRARPNPPRSSCSRHSTLMSTCCVPSGLGPVVSC
jgi:CheY-like chemotaxis protein